MGGVRWTWEEFDIDGALLTSTRDVVDRWKEYFEDLLNPTDTPSVKEAGPGDRCGLSYLWG